MKYCGNCGHALPDEARFCGNCGSECRQINIVREPEVTNPVNRRPDTRSSDSPALAQSHASQLLAAILLGLCVILIILPWVHFRGSTLMAGKIDDTYNALTIPKFRYDYFQFLYWRMYEYWGHNGPARFLASAKVVRAAAYVTVIFDVCACAAMLMKSVSDNKKYAMGIVSAIATGYLSLHFIIWMRWFQNALVKYDGTDYRKFVSINIFPFVTALLAFYLLYVMFMKAAERKRQNIQADES